MYLGWAPLCFSAVISLLLLHSVFAFLEEAPDGSVCFNGCSGHGDCIDYSCNCWAGYIGDDCSTTFADESDIVPILTAGHFNVTRKNFTQTISKHKLILVGFSSYSCHKCIAVEPSYRNISESLKEMKIPFARANAAKLRSIAAEVGATELPALVLFHKQRPLIYKGSHSSDAVLAYMRKQTDKPAKVLKTVEDVASFFESRETPSYSLSTVMTVGFFSEHEDIEEDDYEEYMEVAKELQTNEDMYFGVVTSSKTAEWFKKNKTIDRTPSLVMRGVYGEENSVNLDELFGGDYAGIRDWLLKKSLPLVSKMTAQNFVMYEKLGIPIIMMFLDLTDEFAVVEGQANNIVGGKSGGILNELLLEEFRLAAKEHVNRLAFVYLDGAVHHDQMKSLGLYGGKERLPSLAFNTRDGTQVPFPEELPVNKDTILQFCADYISGKIRSVEDSKEMAKKALQTALPINTKNTAVRKALKKAPEVVQGVAEQFGDGIRGDNAVVTVTLDNFDEVVLNEDKDVVLLLHAKSCEPCAHFTVYYKRMADRFRELAIPSLTIARMDVSNESPPAAMNLMVGQLPIVVMIPAYDKNPPWNFYSGLSKVQQMMKWVHQHTAIDFDLENLPHLMDEQKDAYKEQVREREIALDKKRTEDKRAMEAEERAQAEIKRRQRKADRKRGEPNNVNSAAIKLEGESIVTTTTVAKDDQRPIVGDELQDSDEF